MIKLHVRGAGALFTRPEFKSEPVSYDVLTPSAARGILEAIHWKPAMRWTINRITVLNRIRFSTIRRNEVKSKIATGNIRSAMSAGSTNGLCLITGDDRVQRTSMYLKDVSYIIEASIALTAAGRAASGESITKHVEIAKRRAAKGQCFHRPYLGTREFACDFALLDGDAPMPHDSLLGERDLGWMLHDIDYANDYRRSFFRARMVDGVIDVPARGIAE